MRGIFVKKIRILKSIFWVSYLLILAFGSYYYYRLMLMSDTLKQIYIDKNFEYYRPFFGVSKLNDERTINVLGDRFDASIIALLVFFIFVMLAIFVFYFLFKVLYLFYFCNDETVAIVEPRDYRYYLAFKDDTGELHTNHSPKHQSLYDKIYKKRKGEIELFYDKRNPKNFIIGNKPVFLRDEFIKPFFLDLFIFICIFAICLLFKPFLFISVI